MKRNPTRPRLKVTADGKSVVGHAGARLLSDLADEALDPELSREELVAKVKEIAELASTEEEEEPGEE